MKWSSICIVLKKNTASCTHNVIETLHIDCSSKCSVDVYSHVPCAQTGEYATDEEEEAGQTGTDRDVAIEVFDLPENEDIISPSELDATKLYQKFREVNLDCMHFLTND